MKELEPGYYIVQIVYNGKEIGEEGYSVMLSYYGNEDKDKDTLTRNIMDSKKIHLLQKKNWYLS